MESIKSTTASVTDSLNKTGSMVGAPIAQTAGYVPGMNAAMGQLSQVSAPFTGPIDKTFETMGMNIGFQNVMSGLAPPGMDMTDESLEKFFKELDADGSGKISRDEMKSAITKMYGKELEGEIVDKMMKAADSDGDGEISLAEFKTIMRAGPEKDAPKLPLVGELNSTLTGMVPDGMMPTGGMESLTELADPTLSGLNSVGGPIKSGVGSTVSSTIGIVPGANELVGSFSEFGAPVTGPADQIFETMGMELGFQNVMSGLGGANMDKSDAGLERLFKELDIDGSGNVSRVEMDTAITRLFGEVNAKLVDKMMKAADTDGDGEISLSEFKVIMLAGPDKTKAAPVPYVGEVGTAMSGTVNSLSAPVMGPLGSAVTLVPGANGAMTALNEFGAPITGPLDQVFDTIGVEVGFQSVMKGLDGAKIDLSDAGLAKLFATIDLDGSGNVSRAELQAAITKFYGKPLEAKVMTKMMAAADTDGDGEISLDEFKTIMRAGPEKETAKIPLVGEVGGAMSGTYNSLSGPVLGPMNTAIELVPGMTGAIGAMNTFGAPITGPIDKVFDSMGLEVGFQNVMTGLGGANMDRSDAGLEKFFKEMDEDASGSISRAEMAKATTKLYGKPLEPHVLDKMMKAADTDGDGEISLAEFKAIMKAGPRKDKETIPFMSQVGGAVSSGYNKVSAPVMGPVSSGVDKVPGMSGSMSMLNKMSAPLTAPFDKAFATMGVEVGFQSVMTGLGGANTDTSDAALGKLFASLDCDGSGKISRAEMEAAITKMYGKTDAEMIDQMMKAADKDGDGEISLVEFKAIMRAGPKSEAAEMPFVADITDGITNGVKTVTGPAMGPIGQVTGPVAGPLNGAIDIVPGVSEAMSAATEFGAPILGPLDQTFETMGVEVGFQNVMGAMGGAEMDRSDAGLDKFFAELDVDGSGNISRTEMETAITKLYGKPVKPELVDKMMKAADTDGDGEISLAEFKAIMKAGPRKDKESTLGPLGQVGSTMTTGFATVANPMMQVSSSTVDLVPGMSTAMGATNQFFAPLTGPLDKTFSTMGVEVGFQSVCAGLGGPNVDKSDASLEKLFKELDGDASGHVSRAEMEAAITKMYGKPLEPHLIDAMMKAADTDGDGEISLAEFKTIMRAAPDKAPAEKPNIPFVGDLSGQMTTAAGSLTAPAMGPVNTTIKSVPGMTSGFGAVNTMLGPITGPIDKTFATFGVTIGFQKVVGGIGLAADTSDAALEKLFGEIDGDKSGNISRIEMCSAITKAYGKPLEASIIDEMMKAADKDGDGEISYDEFKAIMKAGP